MNAESSQPILPPSKEREMFIEIYDQYIDSIYRFIYFKVGNTEEAQDLTSAVFLKTWNYIQRNKVNPKTLKALIYKIARNSVIDFYRERSGLKNSIALDNIETSSNITNITDEKQNLVKQIELVSDMALIEKGLLKLKDEYREVIILRFVEEFSIGEIAKILDKSKGNIRVLIYRALKTLRGLIDTST